jgi:hypothetical protein
MLIVGGILVAIVALIGLFTYFVVVVTFWLLVITYGIWWAIFAFIFKDPGIAYAAAIPATLLTWWIVGRNGEDDGKK